MKRFFQGLLLALGSWILFRAIYLYWHGNSVTASLKNATSAPVRAIGATVSTVSDPKKAAGAKSALSDFGKLFAGGGWNYAGLQTAWAKTLGTIYGVAAKDTTGTSQSSQIVAALPITVTPTPSANPDTGYTLYPA